MRKILQINITCGKGSTGQLSMALYKASLQEGFEAKFAYSAYKPSLETAFQIETKLQNYLRRGLNKYCGRRIKHSRAGTKRLIRYIEKEKPDLIHLHNIQQNSVDYPMLFKYLQTTGIPVVYTLHDCWSFTGGCYHFTSRGCIKYQTGCKNCQPSIIRDDMSITTADIYALKAHLIGENDMIYPVAVSNWLRDCARKSYMGNMKHIPQTIYNGIDISVFYPRDGQDLRRSLNIADNQAMALGVASFWNEERKGLDLFIKLANCLGEYVKIVIIGTGSEIIHKYVANQVISVSKTDSKNELAEYYSAADVFVNASLEETFGMTTAEAMACGTPAVVFNSTACPELVDAKTGIVVAQYSTEALAKAVRQICQNGKNIYSDACVNRIRILFSQNRMVTDYLKLYRMLLESRERS